MRSALSRSRVNKEVRRNEKGYTCKESICTKPNQRATAKSLGLNKIGDFVIHNDDAVLAGKVKVLAHLVKVETVEG